MADVETNWIDFYISLTPVAQTGIWAGVAVASLSILHKPLKQLAEGLVRGVNQGDTVSTPWLSLKAQQERERDVVEQVTENLRAEIKNPNKGKSKNLSEIDDAEIDDLLKKVSNRFVDLIFPVLDFEIEAKEDVKTSLYVTDWRTVSDFLNQAYFAAVGSGVDMPVWSYDEYWRLKNERTGRYISKSGKGRIGDDRPFEGLDITAGDVLVAERIR